MATKLKKYVEKKIRPTSKFGIIVYNIYYNILTFYKQLYVYYPKENHYIGKFWIYNKKYYTFNLSGKSAISFIYELYIKNVYLKYIKLNKGDYVLDIGANAGLFTILTSEKVGENGKVICFEPSDINIKNMKENFLLNNVSNSIIVNKGTYSSKKELKFYINNTDFCNSLYKPKEEQIKDIIKIKVDTVDNILYDMSIDINDIRLIKIDNEESEFETLKGMENLLLNGKDLTILIPDLKYNSRIYENVINELEYYNFKINTKLLPFIIAHK